jgi:hypothetical protein
LISSLRTFEKIKPAVAQPKHKTLNTDRIDKILSCLRYICSNLQTTRVIPVGLLASVIGQLISTQAVLGKSVRLRTRYAYDCVLDRLSWDSPIWLTQQYTISNLAKYSLVLDSS